MSDTLATVRTDVRDNLDESTAAYWSDAEINRKIVNSYRNLWKKIVALRDDWFQSLTAGTLLVTSGKSTYAAADGIPTDIYRIKSIRTTTSGKEFVRWVGSSQTEPEFIEGLRTDLNLIDPYRFLYSLVGSQSLRVSPIPRQSLTATIEYIALPTDPSGDSSTFGVLDPFTDFIKADATVQCLAKGPTGAIEFWQNRKNEEWNTIMQTVGQPRQDQSSDNVIGAYDRYA